ncbi:hypothetical protein NMY22_g6262 [Coprinellus aureogranulatus]|nr:hypothetical protein NMY22_g6262 [Coprinellus aureogranulatus]
MLASDIAVTIRNKSLNTAIQDEWNKQRGIHSGAVQIRDNSPQITPEKEIPAHLHPASRPISIFLNPVLDAPQPLLVAVDDGHASFHALHRRLTSLQGSCSQHCRSGPTPPRRQSTPPQAHSMPPRPAVRTRERPTSAIYLGKGHKPNSSSASSLAEFHQTASSSPHLANGAPGSLPDLPEPESPISSHNSSDSGLPSPPATNSTGSGSTGDPGSVARRQRPLSLASDSSTSTSNSSQKTMSDVFRRGPPSRSVSRSSSRHADRVEHDDDDEDHDDDNEDHTARLDRRQHVKKWCGIVLVLSLMSWRLTMATYLLELLYAPLSPQKALDKLTRLGSPSPTPRSKSPSHASTTSSSRLRQTRIVSQPSPRDPGASGSETERESTSVNTFSSHSQSSSSPASSSQRPITPPAHPALPNTSSPYSRLRNVSAPNSPRNARRLLDGSGGSDLSDSPSSRQRKRASMATMASITQDYEEEGEPARKHYYATTASPGRDRQRDTVKDITASALAAVASSRRSPVSARRRAALPREFREDISTDTGSVVSEARTRRSEDVDNRSHRFSTQPVTPFRTNGVGRSATVRETRYSGGHTRPATLDLRSAANLDVSPTDGYRRERRQTLRGGSAESALPLRSPGGRTLLGEGLRAAGLTKKEEPRPLPTARPANIFLDKKDEWSPTDAHDKGKRRALTYGRSATSMSNYRQADSPEDERSGREERLREHRSTYSLSQPRDLSVTRQTRETRNLSQRLGLDQEVPVVREPLSRPRTAAPVAKATPLHLQERYHTASPMGVKRQSVATPGPGAEHSRLMADSLAMFETVVSKLPSASSSSTPGAISNAEILKHAQILVTAADRIAGLMRAGTTRALDEQINAEVEGDDSPAAPEILEVWRQVGGEYREGLRAADELVRSITSFLVDTGSVMRRLASAPAVSDFGSPATHTRHLSLDDEGLRQQRLTDGESSASGRKSVESRRSWEPALRDREKEREDALRKLGGGRESSLSVARGSPALLAVRERERIASLQSQTPSPASATRPLSSARRLYTPREQARPLEDERDSEPAPRPLGPSDSQRTVQANVAEPSPTPASRTVGRSRTIAVTPSRISADETRRTPTADIPATPVERTSSVRDRTSDRRKPSVASIATVRGSGPPTLTSLTMPSMATIGVDRDLLPPQFYFVIGCVV